jgi:hypothetical protein
MKYNKKYKKDYVNRPENRENYKELNKQYVARHTKKRQIMEGGKAIIRRINKRMEKKIFYFCYFISLYEKEHILKWDILIYNYPIT